ncbi:MAG TPA: SurA N-terminal domain-containing protein [bacterium]|nr:SurA N-terminal domain-containing protein [bacterium]
MSSWRIQAILSLLLAVIPFAVGLGCNKLAGNSSPVSKDQVVAVVDGHNITFGDWMKQLDLLRVFSSQTMIDPDNSEQVKAVLDSLIDQQLVLNAAQKSGYSDPAFDDALKKKLLESALKLKELKEKLEKDMETVKRIQKDYQEGYKRMLLARAYASSQVDKVEVTNKDLKDWYDQYATQAAKSGEKLPPFDRVKDRIKPSVQAEKFLKNLQVAGKVDKKDDVIKKYTDSLSISQQLLDNKGDLSSSLDSKGGDKK